MTGTRKAAKPHKTGLRPGARKLLKRLNSCPETLSELFEAAGEYGHLEDALHNILEYADYTGEDIDHTDTVDVRQILDQVRAALLGYEQNPNLRAQASDEARKGLEPQPGDDELVAIALLVDLVSFTWPQGRMLPMLTRSLANTTFINQTIIFDAPKWFVRWLEKRRNFSGLDVHGISAPLGDRDATTAASMLWAPLDVNSPYRQAEDAIEAARRLI